MADLLSQREGRLLRLTLNRPGKRNALSAELCEAIVAEIETAGTDPTVGAILIDAGGKVFSAGMDLDEVMASDISDRTAIHQRLFTIGARASKPIIAAVQGPALGGGLGLVVNAHVVLAAQGSTFGLTEIRIGMWPFMIFPSIVAAIGERRAVELSLTGRIFGTTEALAWGIAHEITPLVELDDRATSIASAIAESSGEAIALGMSYVRERRSLPAAETLQLAAALRRRAFASADFAEGVKAFHQKTMPAWPSLRKTPE